MQHIPSIEDFSELVITKDTGTKAESVEVSVVTVCFNPLMAGRREVFLKNLNSVQAQEGVLLEHLIIDGGSSDGTLDWLKNYSNTHHIIRIISKPDSGIYEAMNRGIALARGKYIIFLNSDDFFHEPSGMATSVRRIESLHCDFSFAPIRFSGSSTRYVRHSQLAPQKRLHRFLISWPFSHQSMLTSRSMLLRMDGFDTSYKSAADYDLLLRMIASGAKGCFVPISFSTFSLDGFSSENKELAITECIRSLRCFYRNFYSLEMTQEEVTYIVRHRVYPKKYINIYKKSQKLIRERFVGVPNGPMARFSRLYNYIKYYRKCLKTKI
jgi:glycosyltransferase involved in cell wall biosynthesis